MDKKQKIVAGSVAGVVVVALLGGGIAFALNQNNAPDSAQVTNTQKVEVTQKKIVFGAKDFKDADSLTSPLLFHIQGQTDSGKKVDFWHAQKVGEESTSDVAPGKYQVTDMVTPVNADGSIYKLDTNEARDVLLLDDNDTKSNTKTASSASATVISNPEKIEAEDVSAEELDAILDKVKEAVKKGDDTLSKDKVKEVVDKVAANVASNSHADKDKAEDAAKEAEDEADTPADGTATDSAPVSSGSSAPSASASTPASTPASAPASAPVDPHAGQTWHDAVYEDRWVVDVPAQEAVPEQGHWYSYYITSDGSMRSDEHTDEFSIYCRDHKLSYGTREEWIVDVPGKPAVPEQGHYESVLVKDAGWY